MKDPKGEAARWLAQAEYDLRAAQTNADNELYAYACFIAQQAAEKALKAFLYGQGERHVVGHSVGELCRRAAKGNPAFGKAATRLGRLDRYYIPTRYPNGLPSGIPAEVFYADDAVLALTLARETLDLVKQNLNV